MKSRDATTHDNANEETLKHFKIAEDNQVEHHVPDSILNHNVVMANALNSIPIDYVPIDQPSNEKDIEQITDDSLNLEGLSFLNTWDTPDDQDTIKQVVTECNTQPSLHLLVVVVYVPTVHDQTNDDCDTGD